ncbi:hypothetical protein QM013_34815, partial [Pseudomonas aeruginosa]
GEVVVTKNESGAIVSVTLQDKEGRVLSVIAESQPSPALPPFAEKVLAKLRRFNECAEDSDSGGVDIGRHWLDLLTQLGLLNRVQRSPALWEISQQGEDLLGLDVPEIEVPDSMIEKAWQRFERTLQQLETPGQAEAERPEVLGLERYRVERTGQGFWPYCVRAGDGTRELFVGHLKQCKRVAAQLATAFEDGKFVAGELRAELETERMRLAGCGVAALGYFDGCADAYKSASLSDVLRLRADCDAALARVAGLRSLLNSLLCYVERDIDRMRSDRDKSDNKEIYDRSISLAMERLKAAQNAVFTTEPGCDTAVELAAQT